MLNVPVKYIKKQENEINMKGLSVYLVGEGEADGLPPLNGDRDDQEDGG